jgi:hypothetical protein
MGTNGKATNSRAATAPAVAGQYYKPAPANVVGNAQYVTFVQACNLSQHLGKSRGYLVALAGGNAGKKQPAKGFTPFFTGQSGGGKPQKFLHSSVVQNLIAHVQQHGGGLPAGFTYNPLMLNYPPGQNYQQALAAQQASNPPATPPTQA